MFTVNNVQQPFPTITIITSEAAVDAMDISEEEYVSALLLLFFFSLLYVSKGYIKDAEFDDIPDPDFYHPLAGHPDIGELTDLQNLITEAIYNCGESCPLNTIQNHVQKKWKSLKRRDGSEYPSQADARKAMIECLRPNPKVPNLFRREEGGRGDRFFFKINFTIEEALESMRAAASYNPRQKFYK